MAVRLLFAALLVRVLAASAGAAGSQREGALLQTWGQALETAGVTASPIARVVKLLKEMQTTLETEMKEDADLYDKLACWCNTNEYEKNSAISDAESRIANLESSIEALTAKGGELTVTIKQLEQDIADNKQALAEVTELREKEAKEFHGAEVDSIQAVESLKAAIVVLSKHHAGAFPQLSLSYTTLLQGGHKGKKGMSKRGKRAPWDDAHESSLGRSFDEFLDAHGYTDAADADATAPTAPPQKQFLQQQDADTSSSKAEAPGWSTDEVAVLQQALKAASVFVQAKHEEDYYPSYAAKSGQIVGILKELKEQMEGDLSESQKSELAKASNFADLRASKEAEIAAGEAQAEQKENALATATMDLAEAKEDLTQTKVTLSEDEKFMMNLKSTCVDADKNFELRKNARLSEIKAVSETIEILASDDARDSMSATYGKSFMQLSSTRHTDVRRQRASALLRGVAAKAGANAPELSILATNVELDSFARVKKAIDDMVAILKVQQADEVKKQDWCNTELHGNEVMTTKTEDHKADLSAKVDDLGMNVDRLTDEIQKAQAGIGQLHLDLQRATENRQKENQDFQTTVADQRATQAVLRQASEKLRKFYDEQALAQTSKSAQTPPVPQKEYKPSAGASGVMQMIEKLIQEAKELENDSRSSEQSAQAQYETLVSDTNGSVEALSREVATKTQSKAEAAKEKTETSGDLKDTNGELEELGKYNGELHADCDYIVKNFSARQEGRSQEIEALQQAKQILSGALNA